ncbi:MAG: DNA methyltransferase [Candidatus Jordarchaeales archaeon]
MIQRFFFLLSGENEALSWGECKALLEASGSPFKFSTLKQVLIAETTYDSARFVLERAAMCHYGCLLIAKLPFSLKQISSAISSYESGIASIISSSDSFAVRVRCVKPTFHRIDTLALEKVLGETVRKITGAKVNLENPNKLLIGVLTEGWFLFGLCLGRSARKSLGLRSLRYRPFMTPSSMTPYIARTMVNLSRATPRDIFLDPFCGSGSILIEAALVGCRIIGCDIDPRMVNGAKANLTYYGLNGELTLSDARHLPFSCADRVVTDPPYGRAASTKGIPLKKLLQGFLSSVESVLGKKGWLCMASPSNVDVESYMNMYGFQVIETYHIRVHESLTRKIIVSRK